MLATDELVLKSYTGTTTTILSTLIPKIWAPRIERNLRLRAVAQQFIVAFTDLLAPGAGDTLYVPTLPDLGAAESLTEGTDIVINALTTSNSIPLVPTEYGHAIEITRKALDRVKYDIIAEIVDRLSYAMSQTIENTIFALWNATVPSIGGSLTQVYANGKASGTITTNDVFNDQMILKAIQTLESSNNFPFPDGHWKAIITPTQWYALLQDTNTRQDLRWGDPSRLIEGASQGVGLGSNGYRGTLHGCDIFVSNYPKVVTENTVSVQKGLLMAPRWAGVAWKRQPQAVVDPTLYDMGRRRRFGILADFDIELLHNERAVVLASA